jgi:hypothetical protein
MDLAWKLNAVLQGWGGEQLLDTYESERRPMAGRSIREATKNMSALGATLVHPNMLAEGREGVLARETVAGTIRRLKTEELYTSGFVLGARYEDSPAICYDTASAPESTTTHYRPSGAPGSRLPNHWLTAENSIHDLLGKGLTLINLGAAADGDAWAAEATRMSIPFTYIRLNRPDLQRTCDAKYLLVRPDGIIAWRSHQQPDNFSAVLNTVRGALVPVPAL